MKACIFHGPGRVTVEEVVKPKPGSGDVLVKVEAAGLCHSDIRVYRGEKHARPGVIPGHESAGVNTHRVPLEQGPRAYESRLEMDGLKSLVVF